MLMKRLAPYGGRPFFLCETEEAKRADGDQPHSSAVAGGGRQKGVARAANHTARATAPATLQKRHRVRIFNLHG